MSRHNDNQRSDWLDNDEGLYNLWRGSNVSKRQFIRENREMIDEVMDNVLCGKKQAHYLVYG